jgi:hypothetical protein
MRKLLFIIVLSAAASHAHAQNWDEIFRQKKTQQKYLLQQIAGLKVYTDFAAKGYGIATTGLTTISSIKNGELGLHDFFFKGLKRVNPKLKNLPQLAAIISCQLSIVKGCRQNINTLKHKGLLNAPELDYLQKTYGKLTADCAEILEQTFDLLTDSQLEMSDAQRIQCLDTLDNHMQDNLAFFLRFSTENLSLSSARQNDIRQTRASEKIYSINPN